MILFFARNWKVYNNMKTICSKNAFVSPYTKMLVIFLFGLTSVSAQSSRIYVNQHSTGSNTGESWRDAFINLQDAIATAQYGDTILVAEGIYKPTSSTDRTVSFELKNGVAMIGGFAGHEEAPARDLEEFETILSGNIGVQEDSLDNSYHVVYAIGVDSTTTLDGFTITEGAANYSDPSFSSPYLFGGGLLIETEDQYPMANLRIQSCKIINNYAWSGGGIAILSEEGHRASPQILDCEFSRNYALASGGGIYFRGWTANEVAMKIYDCHFEDNFAHIAGGGVYIGEGRWELEVKQVNFKRNVALSLGGGIAAQNTVEEGILKAWNSCFEENESREGAGIGGLFSGNDFQVQNNYQFNLTNCRFERNGVQNREGVAVAAIGLSNNVFLSFKHCTFLDNYGAFSEGAITAFMADTDTLSVKLEDSKFDNSFSALGGISINTGKIDVGGDIKISNSLFSNNREAIDLSWLSPNIRTEVTNSTFVNNTQSVITALDWSLNEGERSSKVFVKNSIFWDPQFALTDIFHNQSREIPSLNGFEFSHNLISAADCDFAGSEEACGLGNLFNVDPHFRDSLNGDFRLAGCSPAINAGSNDALLSEWDLEGNPRVLENRVDLGAYERETFDLVISSIQAEEVSCFGEVDGEVVVTTNGQEPLSYEWTSAGLVGIGNTNLAPGLYAMIVKDQQNCEEKLFVQIDEPDSLAASFTVIPATPGQSDGNITLDEISGGRQPYQWSWSNGATTASIDGLSNGSYEVSVTDGNGCMKHWSFVLEAPNASRAPSGKIVLGVAPNPLPNGRPLLISYQLENSQECQLHLLDLLGQRLQSTNLHLGQKGRFEWPLGQLAEGTYLLQLFGESGRLLAIRRIVIVQ